MIQLCCSASLRSGVAGAKANDIRQKAKGVGEKIRFSTGPLPY